MATQAGDSRACSAQQERAAADQRRRAHALAGPWLLPCSPMRSTHRVPSASPTTSGVSGLGKRHLTCMARGAKQWVGAHHNKGMPPTSARHYRHACAMRATPKHAPTTHAHSHLLHKVLVLPLLQLPPPAGRAVNSLRLRVQREQFKGGRLPNHSGARSAGTEHARVHEGLPATPLAGCWAAHAGRRRLVHPSSSRSSAGC